MQSGAEFHTTLVLRLVLLVAMILFFFMTIGAYANGTVLCAILAGACADARNKLLTILKERETNGPL
jgi:hypothetical protein